MMEQEILDLLRKYTEYAKQLTDELRADLGVSDLLSGVNSGKVPRRGVCKSFGGGNYYFHGVGCRVLTEEIEIDFDFGPNGTLPGADPWKLYDFADAHADAYPWLPDRDVFEQRIGDMIDQGRLRRLDASPSPHLVCPS